MHACMIVNLQTFIMDWFVNFRMQVAPAAMIFIPCRNGWSHRPDEFSSPGDIERGVKALALTLAKLAGDAGAAPASSEHAEL